MLSLQEKLDQIAREREVLAVQQGLARQGLREGDAVRHVASGRHGRVIVARGAAPPAPVVQTDAGEEPYAAEQWVPVQAPPEP